MSTSVLLYFPINMRTDVTNIRTYAPMLYAPPPINEDDLRAYVLTTETGSLSPGLYVREGSCWRFALPQPLLSEVLISSAVVDVYMSPTTSHAVNPNALVFKNGVQIEVQEVIGDALFCVVSPLYIPPQPVPVSDLTLTAARNVSGHRVMRVTADGADYASSAIPSDANQVLGISIGAALAGEQVTIRLEGELTEPSWNWDINQPVFNGVDGLLTQSSAGGYSLIVGIPLTPTTILVAVKQPIITV